MPQCVMRSPGSDPKTKERKKRQEREEGEEKVRKGREEIKERKMESLWNFTLVICRDFGGVGDGQMAQWLRAPAEDLGFLSRTHNTWCTYT